MGRSDRFRTLALSSAAATAVLIGWGGLVRATNSGDGCPDWPKCFGHWIPPFEYHALIEYTHRSLAVVATVLIGLQAIAAFRRHRHQPIVFWASVLVVPLFLVQAALGGVVVKTGLAPGWVTVHFAVAMLVLADLVVALVASLGAERRARTGSFARLALWTAAATYALLLAGTYVRARDAGVVFQDWPLMDGKLVPALGGAATVMFVHRVLAAAVTLLVLWVAIRARTLPGRPRSLVILSTALIAAFAAQVMVGAANVWTGLEAWARAAHVMLAAAIWAIAVGLAVWARYVPSPSEGEGARATPDEGVMARPSVRERTTAYVRLTKPRIIELLLVTTVPAMILAERGIPSLGLVLATLGGGTLAAGSANVINCYLDRDIDEVMRRTRRRPLPANEVSPEQALRFGYALGAVSFLFLSIVVNVLAATLALSAIAFYVFVYTMWLKRTSVQNIVIGGAAGAVPALVGWAAVTGSVGLPAWVLFAIVFVWTPPHFWALSMQYRTDYAAAGIPMMPVVRGEEETRRQILLYTLVLVGTSLLLYPLGHMGPVYLAASVILGGMFLHRALRLWRERSRGLAIGLYRFSILYLGLLFAAVAVDAVLPLAR
ncbi:MAG TPA: heme o synthase [Actinomycetota bacterium]|jgi:protoheme IX farnesyltransferase|nr:heme o synthase [Actinomycetota bacterium]